MFAAWSGTHGPVVVVQWLHVLFGILWFGNPLVLAAIVIPAMNRLPIVRQREIGSAIGLRSHRIFQIVVPLIIILGIVRNTVLGPIRSVDLLLGSAYGLTWLAALIVTTATYLWGLFVIVPSLSRMEQAPLNADGSATGELVAATECQAPRPPRAGRLLRHLHLHDPHALRVVR